MVEKIAEETVEGVVSPVVEQPWIERHLGEVLFSLLTILWFIVAYSFFRLWKRMAK